MSNLDRSAERVKKITAVAVFAAMAYVIHFVHIPVAFLNLDFKDVVMTIGGMYFGPLAGLAMTVLVPLLELPTSETGVYGLIMNVLGSTTFVVVASVIYKFKTKLWGAILALCAAALSMTAVMMLANLFVTPYYMGVEQTAVVGMIPTLLLPFNAIKAILNAALTLCLYKPVTRVLKKSGFTRGGAVETAAQEGGAGSLRSILVLVISAAVAIAALLIIFLVLGGKIAIDLN